MKKILITGAGGSVGRYITKGLIDSGEYDIVATDINPDPELGIVKLDVRDQEAVVKMAEGVDTILHLAWYMGMGSDRFVDTIIPVNIIGTYNVYEAARLNNVRRVVFTSSNHVTGYYRVDEDVTVESDYRPDSFYGLSKCFGELMGRMYYDKYGISSINIRIGAFAGIEGLDSLRKFRVWLSRSDGLQLIKCCIDAGDKFGYLVLYGVSNNKRKIWDTDYLESLIGYKAHDDSEILMEEAVDSGFFDGIKDYRYQGGGAPEDRGGKRGPG